MSNPSCLYIHIPFCSGKCRYCDFYSILYSPKLSVSYIDALKKQIEGLRVRFSTVYIGGGTPTVLDIKTLESLLKSIQSLLSKGYELTIEANPDTLDREKASLLLERGVNRISIGIQSFNDKILKTLGRRHSVRSCLKAIDNIHQAGFENISIDLMFGTPGQKINDIKNNIKVLENIPVNHISWYSLGYEEGTKIYCDLKKNLIKPLEDSIVSEMYLCIIESLRRMGFKQYEISNFARDGFKCRHNETYWMNEEYIGLGASAVSYINGVRSRNISEVSGYIDCVNSGEQVTVFSENLSPIEKAKETAALKIRTMDGIEKIWFKQKTGFDFEELEFDSMNGLIQDGLISLKDNRIFLTPKGILFCDTVSSAFL